MDGYDCYQNALAERVKGKLKQEFILEPCNTGRELTKLFKQSIDMYNNKKPHLGLNMKTPNIVNEKTCGSLTGFN
jgi:putative transposase